MNSCRSTTAARPCANRDGRPSTGGGAPRDGSSGTKLYYLDAEGLSQFLSRDRQKAQELAREKEKRVAHLQQMGMKRLMNQGLARGWTAWR